MAFDPRCDRVLSVGDLAAGEPESLATLALIEEPWFHALLGNHDLMLLDSSAIAAAECILASPARRRGGE